MDDKQNNPQRDTDYHTKLNPAASSRDARLAHRAVENKWKMPAGKMDEVSDSLFEAALDSEASPSDRKFSIEAIMKMNAQNLRADEMVANSEHTQGSGEVRFDV